jgi:acetyl esterase/lipase
MRQAFRRTIRMRHRCNHRRCLRFRRTLVATAEYDVLRDEGIAFAEKLEAAGITVTQLHAPDMNHNFPVDPGTVARFPQCYAALTEIARWLRATLGRGPMVSGAAGPS